MMWNRDEILKLHLDVNPVGAKEIGKGRAPRQDYCLAITHLPASWLRLPPKRLGSWKLLSYRFTLVIQAPSFELQSFNSRV